jgi:hypothetical protein
MMNERPTMVRIRTMSPTLEYVEPMCAGNNCDPIRPSRSSIRTPYLWAIRMTGV